jgi:hypothetical protein
VASIAHISILNVHLNGAAELHRHFLRFPDGAFVEVFGNLETMAFAEQQRLKAHLEANRMTVQDFLYVYKSAAQPVTRDNALAFVMGLHKFGLDEQTVSAAAAAAAVGAAASAPPDEDEVVTKMRRRRGVDNI